MKIYAPELIDKLANEYALGTLHGPARSRFEKLASAHPSIKQRVRYWQNNYADLARKAEPVRPSPQVWKNINGTLFPKPKRNQAYLFGLLGSVCSALLVLVAIYFIPTQAPVPVTPESQVAFIGESAQPQWIIQVDLEKGELTTTAINASAAAIDKTFELWSLPQNANPRSLGLLPVNGSSQTNTLSPAVLNLLKQNDTVAVSIEPAGGSPTGLPTGEVVYTGAFYRL
jgi:anti-sigma-K factor RskA